MNGTDAVCAAKGSSLETPCLAGAYAIARTTINVVKALQGAKIIQCAYVDSLGSCAPDTQFFSSEVRTYYSNKSYNAPEEVLLSLLARGRRSRTLLFENL